MFRVSYLDVLYKYEMYIICSFDGLMFLLHQTAIKLLQMVAPILTCAVHRQWTSSETLSIRSGISLKKIHLPNPRLFLHLSLTLEVDVSLGLLRPVCWGLFLAGSSKKQQSNVVYILVLFVWRKKLGVSICVEGGFIF